MEELIKSLREESVRDLYETYVKICSLIDELNSKKKDLPPKEEL